MRKGLIAVGVVVALLLIAALWFVGARNRLVTMDEDVKSKWSQVENVYQRRADLIPNLVNTVKGYAAHERETLTAVVEARSKVSSINAAGLVDDPEKMKQFAAAQGELSSALSRLLVVVERYPDLKANQGFLDLQKQLEGTENRIAVERKRFNDSVQTYNTAIRRFPTSLAASFGGFAQKPYFDAAPGSERVPQVQF